MPRYFFHVHYNTAQPDSDGSELANLQAAQAAAVRLCGEMIRELDGKFWDAPQWQLRVTNQDQRPLFTLTLSAEDHALIR